MARTGSCLKELRSGQPGRESPTPPPLCAGCSCRGNYKRKEVRPLRPKCNDLGVLSQLRAPGYLLCPFADRAALPQPSKIRYAPIPGRGSGVFLSQLCHSNTLPDTSWESRWVSPDARPQEYQRTMRGGRWDNSML